MTITLKLTDEQFETLRKAFDRWNNVGHRRAITTSDDTRRRARELKAVLDKAAHTAS